ncbi:MAG TPA: SURF1 family protein [Candidatus Acidoferrales bacterium]|nr:SURF1 family protein [Candidatus Acidoferrales bacterium]
MPAVILVGWSAVLALLLGLSLWQLHRAEEKTRLINAFVAAQFTSVGDAPDEESARRLAGEAAVFVKACVTGRYDERRQVLLDGQVQGGQVGLHVWTPLIRETGPPVIVDRGWVAQNARFGPAASLDVGGGIRTVCGTLARFPRSGWRLSPPNGSTDWPRRMVYPDTADLKSALGLPVYPLLLLLDPDAPDGFLRRWQPVSLGPERHYGYAVQWAGLAATWIVATFVYRRRHRRSARR